MSRKRGWERGGGGETGGGGRERVCVKEREGGKKLEQTNNLKLRLRLN